MSGVGFEFLLGNAPILIGALFLLLMLKINPLAQKYIITDSNEIPKNIIAGKFNPGCISFQDYLCELLIMDGIIATPQSIRAVGFERLGAFSLEDLGILEKYPKMPQEGLIAISQDQTIEKMQQLKFSYSKSLGLILPYLLDSKFEAVII